MRPLFDTQGDVITMFSRPDRRFGARVLFAVALVAAVAIVIATVNGNNRELWALLLFPAVFGALALVLNMTSHQRVLDLKRRTLIAAGREFSFDELLLVSISTRVEVTRTHNSSSSQRLWALGFVTAQAHGYLRGPLQDLRAQREQLLAGENIPALQRRSIGSLGQTPALVLIEWVGIGLGAELVVCMR